MKKVERIGVNGYLSIEKWQEIMQRFGDLEYSKENYSPELRKAVLGSCFCDFNMGSRMPILQKNVGIMTVAEEIDKFGLENVSASIDRFKDIGVTNLRLIASSSHDNDFGRTVDLRHQDLFSNHSVLADGFYPVVRLLISAYAGIQYYIIKDNDTGIITADISSFFRKPEVLPSNEETANTPRYIKDTCFTHIDGIPRIKIISKIKNRP